MKTDKEVSNPVANPAPPAATQPAAGECDAPPLRLNSYYFAFETTGERAIDIVLSAVAGAGKSYHHTENWGDDSDGLSCAGRIQTAAVAAADGIAALRAQLATVTAERDALRELATGVAKAEDTVRWLREEAGDGARRAATARFEALMEAHRLAYETKGGARDIRKALAALVKSAAQPNTGERVARRPARYVANGMLAAMKERIRRLLQCDDDCLHGSPEEEETIVRVLTAHIEADRRGEP